MVTDSEIIWEKVCYLIENSGLSLSELVDKSDVPRTTIIRFKKGETKSPGFLQLCQIIVACGGSVDEILEIDTDRKVISTPTNTEYTWQLKEDLRYERKQKQFWIVMFVCIVAFDLGIFLFDILNPTMGYIRYTQQAAFKGQTSFMLLSIILKLKSIL